MAKKLIVVVFALFIALAAPLAAMAEECPWTPTPPPPTATEAPTETPEPTATSTQVPPTATPLPPTATQLPPTATPVPPTATALPPTATPVTPTATDVPPTATAVPPTVTPVTVLIPPVATEVLPPAAPPTAVPPTVVPPTAVPPTVVVVPPTPEVTPNAPVFGCIRQVVVIAMPEPKGKAHLVYLPDTQSGNGRLVAAAPVAVGETTTTADEIPWWWILVASAATAILVFLAKNIKVSVAYTGPRPWLRPAMATAAVESDELVLPEIMERINNAPRMWAVDVDSDGDDDLVKPSDIAGMGGELNFSAPDVDDLVRWSVDGGYFYAPEWGMFTGVKTAAEWAEFEGPDGEMMGLSAAVEMFDLVGPYTSKRTCQDEARKYIVAAHERRMAAHARLMADDDIAF